MDVKKSLQEIFREVFEDEELEIFEDMTAEDVEDWDSLAHMELIIEIEKFFKVKFKTDEINNAKNVGEFISLIESKLRG